MVWMGLCSVGWLARGQYPTWQNQAQPKSWHHSPVTAHKWSLSDENTGDEALWKFETAAVRQSESNPQPQTVPNFILGFCPTWRITNSLTQKPSLKYCPEFVENLMFKITAAWHFCLWCHHTLLICNKKTLTLTEVSSKEHDNCKSNKKSSKRGIQMLRAEANLDGKWMARAFVSQGSSEVNS